MALAKYCLPNNHIGFPSTYKGGLARPFCTLDIVLNGGITLRKIPRFWARVTILLAGIGIALLYAGIFTPAPARVLGYLAGACIVTSLGIKYLVLRCSYCGWGGMIPRWSKPETIHCPKCGKVPEYDY